MKGSLGGDGEQQLELERRIIQEKQSKISKELEQEMKSKNFLREKRAQQRGTKNTAQVAIIGYTNSGKSQLMNLLLGRHTVQSKDMLFQTLESTLRALRLPSGSTALLQDTVGFISDLPHALFASFKSCLDDIHSADVVLHLVDVSNPFWKDQRQTVLDVLKDMKVDKAFYDTKLLEAWNKINLLTDEERAELQIH